MLTVAAFSFFSSFPLIPSRYNCRMVSVVHSVAAQNDFEHSLQTLSVGLTAAEAKNIRQAAEFAQSVYGERLLGSGEGVWRHALGMALILVGLKMDADARLAALLFALPTFDEQGMEKVEARFGPTVANLVNGITRLHRLRPITHGVSARSASDAQDPAEIKAQIEVLRKMLLAMVEDIRVVLLRLASRTQTLRHYAKVDDAQRAQGHVADAAEENGHGQRPRIDIQKVEHTRLPSAVFSLCRHTTGRRRQRQRDPAVIQRAFLLTLSRLDSRVQSTIR